MAALLCTYALPATVDDADTPHGDLIARNEIALKDFEVPKRLRARP